MPFFKGDAFPDHRKHPRFLPVFTTHARTHTLYTTQRPSSSARQEPRIRRPTFSSPPARLAFTPENPAEAPPRSPPRAHTLTTRVPSTSRGDVLSPRLFREPPPAQVSRFSPLPGPPESQDAAQPRLGKADRQQLPGKQGTADRGRKPTEQAKSHEREGLAVSGQWRAGGLCLPLLQARRTEPATNSPWRASRGTRLAVAESSCRSPSPSWRRLSWPGGLRRQRRRRRRRRRAGCSSLFPRRGCLVCPSLCLVRSHLGPC